MAKKKSKLIWIMGIVAVVAVVFFAMGGNPFQAIQSGEDIVLECSSKESCRALFVSQGATSEQAEQTLDLVKCSDGVCTMRVTTSQENVPI